MSEQPSNIDLTFVTTDELVDELRRRTDASVVAYALKSEDGGSHVCLGGLRIMVQGLLLEIESSVKRRIDEAHGVKGKA
jgi:hypothetical protein